jgi:hypothetical protein
MERDMIMTNRKGKPFLTPKIVEQCDPGVSRKIQLISSLLGNYRGGEDIKRKYLQMLINGNDLVQGRAVGKGQTKNEK